MTNDAKDANPLDELIARIDHAEPFSCEGGGEAFEKGFKYCRRWAADIIRRDRPHIEAGLQKPLRWKKRSDLWILLNTGLNPMVQGKCYIFCYSKDQCTDFANDLGLPAVFVEEEDDAEKEPVDKMLADAQRDIKEFNQRIMVDPNSLHEPTGLEKIQNSEEAERDGL